MSSGTRSRSLSARSATALRDNAPFRSACASRGVLWRSAFPCLNRSVRELEAGVIGRSSPEGHALYNFCSAATRQQLGAIIGGRLVSAKAISRRFWHICRMLGGNLGSAYYPHWTVEGTGLDVQSVVRVLPWAWNGAGTARRP